MILSRSVLPMLVLSAGILLSGCSEPTKAEIIKMTENITTKAELTKALGKPESVATVGPLEKWTYRAEDGVVVFVITGESVALQAQGR